MSTLKKGAKLRPGVTLKKRSELPKVIPQNTRYASKKGKKVS